MKKHALPVLSPIELDGYTLDLQHFFGKEYTDICEASVELPSIIEWLNYQLQAQIEQKHRLKASVERSEAEAYFRLKNGDFQRLGYGEKTTDKALDYAIKTDESVIQFNEDYAVTAGWVARLENLQRSLQYKLELVRSSEATRRTVAGNI